MYAEYTQLQLTFIATEYNLLGIPPPAPPPPSANMNSKVFFNDQ